MLIKIEFDSEIPIYEQLRRELIIGIARGDIKKGERLPSVRQLGEDLGINLHTVNKTYNLLKDDGYLVIDRRVGAMVSGTFDFDKIAYEKNLKEELEFFIADAKNKGIEKEEFLKISQDFYEEYGGDR